MNKSIVFFFIYIIVLSCSNKTELINQDTIINHKSLFRYNEPGGISSLDPARISKFEDFLASRHLFNGLVSLDSNLNISPCISKSWNISSDGKTYTFNLRTDVYFHESKLFKDSTRTVLASDVQFSFSRIINPETASPGKYIFNNVLPFPDGIKVMNDSTVQIKLLEPQPSFLHQLCLPYGSILPYELVLNYKSNFSQNAIGTGPFKLKTWKKDVKMVLVKNEKYFEKDNKGVNLPYIDAVAITFLSDKQQELLKFKLFNLEMISGINEDDKDMMLTSSGELKPEFKSDFYLQKKPWLNTDYLAILVDDSINNITENPLRYKKIRQAISYAIDRNKFVKYLRNGIGVPANNGFIPLGMPGFSSFKINGISYNENKAIKLFKELDLNEIKLTLSASQQYKVICEFLQKQLEKIGFVVSVEIYTPSALKQRVINYDANFYRKSWVADFPDAINYFQLFYSKYFYPKYGYNYTHFKHDLYDQIYEKAIIEQDTTLKYSLYKQLNEILNEQSPVIPLFYGETLRFFNKSVSGVSSNSMNILDLKRVRINKL